MKKRLIVGITGATGAVYGVRMLEALKTAAGWESRVVLSDAGALNLWHELKMEPQGPRGPGDYRFRLLLRARQTTAPPTMRDLPTASRT